MENQKIEWEEIQPDTWKPEKDGDSVQGILINVRENVGPNQSMMYTLEDPETKKFVSVWGSTILDNRMSLIKVGEAVKIEYKGTQTNTKGQPVKIFKVSRGKLE